MTWAIEHQSDEDAQKWLAGLDAPLPGEAQTESVTDEMAQLKNL
jgi:hypothetical protein